MRGVIRTLLTVVLAAGLWLAVLAWRRATTAPMPALPQPDPELDARRFRRTEDGVSLITQPMIDRLG